MLASKKYGAPYCGSPLKDDDLAQGVKFWVSGIAVGSVGIPGNAICAQTQFSKMNMVPCTANVGHEF